MGVLVNNAIVLIDYINILRRERGMELVEALKTAGSVRLRAILMSSGTTVLGLVPMAIGAAEGAETMQPLGIVIAFGLTISTLVTLLLIPSLYLIFEGIGSRIKLYFNKSASKTAIAIEGERQPISCWRYNTRVHSKSQKREMERRQQTVCCRLFL